MTRTARLASAGAAMVLLAGGCSQSPGGSHGPVSGVPEAVFDAARQDLGPVPAGESKEARFPVRNAGGSPLRILGVDADCGCLQPHFPQVVAPGREAEIRTRFEPHAEWEGRVERLVTVRTNSPGQPQTTLTVAAEVIPYVRHEPPGVIRVGYRPGEVVRQQVLFTPREGSGVMLRSPQSTLPLVRPRLDPPGPSDPKRAQRLHLEIGPCPGPGDFTATIRLATTEPKLPMATLAVVGEAQEGPVVNPREIFVPTVASSETGNTLTRMQVFTRGRRLHLLKVATGDPALRSEIQARIPDRHYDVALKYAGGWQPGTIQRTLQIITDDARHPVLTVPFHATVR